ncbi:MAG: hypothetical protein IJA32_01895 [Lachnospiraceae bacterium]|nr:hypothetical protein [Lachnospiraceae bacterium]
MEWYVMYINYEKIAIEVGYSYLNGGYGYWEDRAEKLSSYDSMDNDYLKNCINFIDKGIKEIDDGTNGINKDIKRYLCEMIEEPNEKDIKYVKKQIKGKETRVKRIQ